MIRWILLIPVLAFLEIGSTPFQAAAQRHRQSTGTIVFIHAPDDGAPWPVEDIYSMDADGTNVKALTNDGHSHTPAWSPDGRRILFIHDSILRSKPPYDERKGFESYHPVELYLMNNDGTNRRNTRQGESMSTNATDSENSRAVEA